MTTLRLTVNDTAPIKCSYPADLSGASVQLLIGSVSKAATVTSYTNGLFQFARSAGDLAAGTFESVLVITTADGSETTEPFATVVSARPS